MVNNAEAISRLIANDTLLRGERQLLRKQEQSSQGLGDEAAQSAAPLTHNGKAVEAVLLTLLDEQLDASVAETASRPGASSSAVSHSSDTASASNRVAARYAEDGLAYQNNSSVQPAALPLGQSSQQIAQAASSPELQLLMQRFLMSAATRVQANIVEDGRSSLRKRGSPIFSTFLSTTQIASGVFALAGLAIILLAHFAR